MGKRGQNEGSIYQRGDGRWTATITLGYVNGKRKRKSYYGKTRREVQTQLTHALADQQRGMPVPVGRQSVAQFVQDWLESVCRPSVKQSTYESYERLLRVQVLPQIGRIALTKLEPQDLARLYTAMLEGGSAPRTAQYAHAVLHRALKQAVQWNLIGRNPTEAVDPPRPNRIPIQPLDMEQIQRLLAEARADRFSALYVLALTAGMRQGELLGLRWADVNLTAQTVQVRQQVARLRAGAPAEGAKSGMVFSDPKTAKGRRSIALPRFAVEALRAHRSAQLAERLVSGAAWQDNDLVFPNQLGKPIEKQNLVRRSFVPLLRRAGLPSIRFHDLRHSAATMLLTQGIHPKVVQERLGHSTITTTMDVYSHVMPTLQREAAERLDAAFGSA